MALSTILLQDFSGGLDLVSSLNTIPPSYTPSARNFRLVETGGVEKVQGYAAFATVNAAHDLTYYEQRSGSNKCLVAAGSTTWQKVDSAGTVTTIRTAMTANTETSFVQYEDALYGLDRSNNLAKWDGATLTSYAPGVDTGPKQGIILGVWQNRMWVTPATGMRVEFSAAGTFTGTGSWPANNYVELGGPGTSDKIVGGMPTPDGLLVFTNRSTYLIYDDTTGANRLVDSERGCSSRKSLARVGDTIYGVCPEGVFATTGGGMALVTDRIAPMYQKGSPTLTASAGIGWGSSYISSLARLTSTNDICVELLTTTGSLMAFDYPVLAWAKGALSGTDKDAYFIDASDATRIRKAFTGGSFAGTDITCTYDTPLNPLGDETDFKRLRRVRIVGRGRVNVGALVDYDSVPRATAALAFPSAGTGVWGSSLWGVSTWAGYQLFEGWASLSAIGRRFTLRITETSSDTNSPRSVIGKSISGNIGGAGAYLIEAHFSPTRKRRQL